MIQTVLAQVNITPDGIPEVVKLSQYENGRELRFEIVGNGMNILDTDTVTISGTKPDKTVYSAEGTLDNGVAVFDEDIQMTAALGMWDAKIKIIRGSETVATGRITFVIDSDTTNEDDIPSSSVIDGYIAEARLYAEEARSAAYGSPLVANTAADMDDETRVYVYTGDETGYTAGNWYYYDGEEWTSGGVYNSSAVQTDPSLSIPGMAADAAAVGEQLFSSETTQNNKPYLFRSVPVPATREKLNKVVGGTVAWNQLVTANNLRSRTVGGLTFTNNSDGSVSVSGTATSTNAYSMNTSAITAVSGEKYYVHGIATTANYGITISSVLSSPVGTDGLIVNSTQTAININLYVVQGATLNIKVYPQLHDLTQMLGSTIADYIYSLEQSTAGAGVAFFRKLFPADYYAYNAGELKSVGGVSAHETVGFNQFDKNSATANSAINANGEVVSGSYYVSDKIKVLPDTQYYANNVVKLTQGRGIVVYKADGSVAVLTPGGASTLESGIVTTPSDAEYIRIATATPDTCCINLSDPSRNGTYEAYKKYSYPLDSSLTLRGILKKDSNNALYFDGDTYAADGTVTRRYGVVDLGTLAWDNNLGNASYFYSRSFDNIIKANTGVVCQKYPMLSIADNNAAILAITDTGIIIKKDATSGNVINIHDPSYTTIAAFKTAMSGVYLVYELATATTEEADPYQQTQICDPDGTETFVTTGIVPVGHVTEYPHDLKGKVEQLYGIPKPPTANGTYALKVTVSGSTITYSWV